MPTDNRPSQAVETERPLRCGKCGGFIATHTAKRLSIGASFINQPLELICGFCLAKVHWGPKSVAEFHRRTT